MFTFVERRFLVENNVSANIQYFVCLLKIVLRANGNTIYRI